MSDLQPIDQFFNTLAKILLRCWIFGLILLGISAATILFAGDSIYTLNERMFSLTRHEVELVIYGVIVLIKILVLVFFFIPWLAIRLR